MANETIDKLIYALDGDLSAWRKTLTEAETQAQKTGAKVGEAFKNPLKTAASDVATSAGAIKKALGDTEKAVTSTHGSVAMATREFRALFDELSSGRTRQTPGTLAIIATRVFGISGATLAWGAALAAIPVGFAVAAAQAEASMARIRTAMALTGNASGLTQGSAAAIAAQIAAGGHASQMGGLNQIAAMARFGAPASMMAQAGIAQNLYSMEGAKSEDAQKVIQEIFANPAKAAAELNASMNLLTGAQTRQVDELDKTGQQMKAAQIVLDAFSERTKEASNSVSLLGRISNSIGTFFGNIGTGIGHLTGAIPQTPQERLAYMQAQLRGAQSYRAQYGNFGPGANEDVANILATFPAQIVQLQKQIAQQNADAAKSRQAAADNVLLRGAKGLVDSWDTVGKKQEELGDKSKLLAADIAAAARAHDPLLGKLKDMKAAVDAAASHQLDPAKEAALRAAEEARINAARPEDRARISAQVAAQRSLRANLANPAMVPYAQSIFASEMATANATDRFNRQEDMREKNLLSMQAEAESAEKLAKAYDLGTAAAERAKIEGDAHDALVKKQISNEQAYAAALEKRAFWQAAASASQKIADMTLSNAGLASELAAGGNPYLVAQAKRQAEAVAATQKEFDSATTPEAIARATADRSKYLSAITARDTSNAALGIQGSIFGARQNLGNLQAQFGLGGDDLRRMQVMQQTMDQLVKSGLDPASNDFKKLYDELLPLNLQISDLTEKMQDLRKASQDYANDITGPLENFLEKGGSLKTMIGRIFQGIGDTTIHDFIIQPLNKMLDSGISGLLGVPFGKADGSITNPYYVMMAPQGALLGGAAGGGLLGGLLGDFGSNGKSGTGVLGVIGNVFGSLFGGGKAGGGYIDPGKFYMVGEKGPELLGPGVGGNITPLTAPQTTGINTSAQVAAPMHITYGITVAGSGDKELLQRMQTAAESTVQSALKTYDTVQNRTLRGRLINANKRAMV